ncbi:unnamed protein product, partial [Pleuronectes platessa]
AEVQKPEAGSDACLRAVITDFLTTQASPLARVHSMRSPTTSYRDYGAFLRGVGQFTIYHANSPSGESPELSEKYQRRAKGPSWGRICLDRLEQRSQPVRQSVYLPVGPTQQQRSSSRRMIPLLHLTALLPPPSLLPELTTAVAGRSVYAPPPRVVQLSPPRRSLADPRPGRGSVRGGAEKSARASGQEIFADSGSKLPQLWNKRLGNANNLEDAECEAWMRRALRSREGLRH